MLRRIDERAPLEEALLSVDEASDVLSLVLAETAPEHEEVTSRDCAGRIELQPDDPLDGREDPAAVGARSFGPEELRVHGEPARDPVADLVCAKHLCAGAGRQPSPGARRRFGSVGKSLSQPQEDEHHEEPDRGEEGQHRA